MKSTFNVKNDCVKTSTRTIQKKTFNVRCCSQTLLNQIRFSNYTFHLISAEWRWRRQLNDSTVVVRFFENEITKVYFFRWKTHSTISLKRFIRINSFRSIKFPVVKSARTRLNATNRHFDRVNSLPVLSLGSKQQNRQLRQCIWSFGVRCSFFGIKSTVCSPYSLTASVSSRKTSDQRNFATDNRQRASDRFTVGCSSLASRQFRQCTRWHRHRVQSWQSDNRQRASDDIGIGCSSLTIRQLRQCIWLSEVRCSLSGIETTVSVHLMASASDAAVWQSDNFASASDASASSAVFLTSDNTASASNLIAIGCSNSGINCLSSDRDGAGCSNVLTSKQLRQCIWWFQHQMQHSDITFIWSFFYVTGGRSSYTFIWSSFLKKRHQSSAFNQKSFSYR